MRLISRSQSGCCKACLRVSYRDCLGFPESFAEGFSVRSPREIHGITYIDQLYIETYTSRLT